MLHCPHCGEVLTRSRVAGVELDGCHSCGGTFFDAGELATLAREPAHLYEVDRAFRVTQPALAAKESRACPRCQTALVQREQPSLPGVPFDACPHYHGIWLNGGQAAEIAQRRGAERPASMRPSVGPAHIQPPERPEPRHMVGALVMATITLALVLYTGSRSARAARGERVPGRVIDVHRSYEGGRRSRSSRATIQIQMGQVPFTFEDDLWAFDRLIAAGDAVDVCYPYDRPDLAMISSFSRMWLVPLFLLVLGSTMTAAIYRNGIKLGVAARWGPPRDSPIDFFD